MKISWRREPEEARLWNWHPWFAWYPVRVFDAKIGWGTWVWLETVERVYEFGQPNLKPYYRLRELWRK
jgi:hypothetical protein